MYFHELSILVRRRVLGIEADDHNPRNTSFQIAAKAAFVTPYVEQEPSVKQSLLSLAPTQDDVRGYVRSLFPFTSWIMRYNWSWLIGDAIAGLTVGFVVIPQGMAYALLAGLGPEYGLYTSFAGAALYWIFGTSKDIVIGTTAVGSLLVGGAITTIENKRPGVYSPEEIAKSLSFLSGLILILLGLLRLGWLIELIPYIPISAFVSTASITIIGTQLPVALGITGVNTRQAPYHVYIDTLRKLPTTKLDAAIGLTSIIMLSAVRGVCAKMEVRQPSRQKMWATMSSLRLTFTILLYTLVSWLVHRSVPHEKQYWKFRLVGKIESGFSHVGPPVLSGELIKLVSPQLPAIIIILIIEHIAIAKSFGRRYGYIVIPSQEILAQGVSNALGTLLGGYACTGSFGASAVLTKAGVRTPLAGLFSAMVLILALYVLTSVFYFIPMAALAGLIIHAVSNLMTPPSTLFKYWKLSPMELLIWITGVAVGLFISLEVSIYTTIALSFAMLLVRIARPHGVFLGQVSVERVVRSEKEDKREPGSDNSSNGDVSVGSSTQIEQRSEARRIYLPMRNVDNLNPKIKTSVIFPGIFLYRFEEALNYVNAARHMDQLSSYIMEHSRCTRSKDDLLAEDRLWSDPVASASLSFNSQVDNPILRAIILECSTLNYLDVTSIQSLVDLRTTLDRYVAPAVMEWHFAGLHNKWTRQALSVVGFGRPPSSDSSETLRQWCSVYSVASSLAGATKRDRENAGARRKVVDEEGDELALRKPGISTIAAVKNDERVNGQIIIGQDEPCSSSGGEEKNETKSREPVYGVERPFFHIDLADAIDMAIRNAKRRDLKSVVRVSTVEEEVENEVVDGGE